MQFFIYSANYLLRIIKISVSIIETNARAFVADLNLLVGATLVI